MATRFYFHNAIDSTDGLPIEEQSTLSLNRSVDSGSTNRQMNSTVGTSEATLQLTSIASTSQQNYYVTRFVSPALGVTSIAANTWTYTFTASTNSLQANFPVSGTNQPVYVNCYVWRPSTSTKIGTIQDGNTLSTVDEGNAFQQHYHIVNFMGSAVSSMQATDVLCFEVWFRITQSSATGYTDNFRFDGTTVYSDNEISSNAASYLETPEDLAATELVGQTSIQKYDIRQNALQTSTHEYDILQTGVIQVSSKHKYKILTGEDGFTVFMRLWIPFFNNEIVYGKRGVLFSKIDDEQVTYAYTAQLSNEGDIYFIVKDNSREYSLTVHNALEFETASPPDFIDSDFNSMDFFTLSSIIQPLPNIIPYDDIAFNYEFSTHRIQIIKNGQIIADTNSNPEGSGLVAWFRLNEGGDIGDDPDEPTAYTRTVYNGVETGNNGTITNAVWETIPGSPHETYLSFNGTDSRVEIDNYLSIQSPTSVTVSLWYYHRALPNTTNYIIRKNPTDAANHWTIYSDGTFCRMRLRNQSNTIYDATFSSAFPNTDTWYHIVGKWTMGSAVNIFINNSKVVGDTTTGTISGTGTLGIGNFTDVTPDGLIHDVKIWNRELSEAEVTTLYNNGHPVSGFPPWQANPPPPPEIPLPITNPFVNVYELLKPGSGIEWSKIHKLIVSGITEVGYNITQGTMIPPATLPFTARYTVV